LVLNVSVVKMPFFDVLVEFAVAVDDAKGVSHLVEDGGEEVVFTGGCAVGGGLEVVVCSGEFAIVLWCGVDEPANSVGIVVDADGGFVGATKLVVACNAGFG
jgi:hypothetical protein